MSRAFFGYLSFTTRAPIGALCRLGEIVFSIRLDRRGFGVELNRDIALHRPYSR